MCLKFRLAKAPSIRSLEPRKIHVYCIGTPKSGTTSMAGIFSLKYRSFHEPLAYDLIHRFWKGKTWRDSDIANYLYQRDRLLNLEAEASHPLLPCISTLVKIFPNSRFIFTIRDCYSWLESIMNEEAETKQFKHAYWGHFYRSAFLDKGCVHPPEEKVLKHFNLGMLSRYFDYWVQYHNTIVNSVPADRLLIIKTKEISSSLGRIAKFLGVAQASLNPLRSHKRQRNEKAIPLTTLNLDYVTKVAHERAGKLIYQLFPEFPTAHDVI
jgi:hypothetical protein